MYGATKSEDLAGAAFDSGTQHDSSAGALVQLQYCASRLASAKWAYNNILFSCGFQSPALVLPRSVAAVQIPNEMLQVTLVKCQLCGWLRLKAGSRFLLTAQGHSRY